MTDWNEVKDNITLEKAIAMLEETVKAMEDSSIGFDDNVALYKRANEIYTFCRSYLRGKEKEVISIDEYIERLTREESPLEEEDQ